MTNEGAKPVLPRADVRQLIEMLHEVRERWPFAVARVTLPGKLEFYLAAWQAASGIPVAVLDVETGRLEVADPEQMYRSLIPTPR